MTDLFTLLDKADPWQFMAGLFVILWVVEVRFGGRAQAKKEQVLAARLEGYAMAADQVREQQQRRWAKELTQEEALAAASTVLEDLGGEIGLDDGASL